MKNKRILTMLAAGILATLSLPQGRCASIEVTVYSRSGPWDWTTNGLNNTFQYGLNNQDSPTVLSAAHGLDFTSGNVLAVEYVSGLVYEGGGWPLNDANGASSPSFYIPVTENDDSPALYFDPADYPSFAAELAGTFADDSGAIVGTPFEIGNFRYLTIPAGATRLQLGNIDGEFSDNSGSWQIRVSNVPRLEIKPTGHLVLHAPVGSTNRIEYISELGTTNWQALTNIVLQQSPSEIMDSECGLVPRRFYRAVLSP
jgi:hypothetical protein